MAPAGALGAALAQIAAGLPWDVGDLPLSDEFRAQYSLQKLIASGSAGVVFVARQHGLGRLVAVKFLASAAPELRERFRREASLLVAVAHPNVMRVLDSGEVEGQPYHALEYLSRGTLAARIASAGKLPVGEAAEIGQQCLAGLAACHARGVVHRDLKPENVLFGDDGQARLADLGIARDDQAAGLTREGALLGTPRYMAPEQARGEPASEASDLYAIGAMLYHMLGGRPPFQGTDPVDVLRKVILGTPDPLGTLAPDLPRPLIALVHRALAKAPHDRPTSAPAFAAELAQIVAPVPSGIAGRSAGPRPGGGGRSVLRHRRVLAAAVTLWLGIFVMIGSIFVKSRTKQGSWTPLPVPTASAARGASAAPADPLRHDIAALEDHFTRAGLLGAPPLEERTRVRQLLGRARTALGPRCGGVFSPAVAMVAMADLFARAEELRTVVEESMLNILMDGQALKAGRKDWLAARTQDLDELMRDVRDLAPAALEPGADALVQARFAQAAVILLKPGFSLLDPRLRARFEDEIRGWMSEHPDSFVPWYIESERLAGDHDYVRDLDALERARGAIERGLDRGDITTPQSLAHMWIEVMRKEVRDVQKLRDCPRIPRVRAAVEGHRARALALDRTVKDWITAVVKDLDDVAEKCGSGR